MNEDGTNERKLTDRDVEEECPAWSPDGNMIAFSSRCYDMTKNWAIYYFDLKSKTIKKVYIGTGYSRFEMSPSWAPDSTRGIYEGLCIFDLKGKHPKYLQSDKIAHICGEDPAWSPDGKSIAFSLDHSIYRVDLKDEGDDEFIYCSEPKAIIARGKTLHSYSQPAWSPDGKKIAYACNVYFDPYPDSPFRGKYHIGVMDSDGRNMKELTTSDDILDCDPVWSPNGKHIAFSTGSPFKRNIHVIDLKLVPRK
jgi:TolB protein